MGQVAASASADGTLVYLAGRSRKSRLTWFDRTGKALGAVGPQADQLGVFLSPDATVVANTRLAPNDASAFWLTDLVRGSESRVTPPGSPGIGGLWSADSSRIFYSMQSNDAAGLFWKHLKSGQQELVWKADPNVLSLIPSAWSPDGRFLIYTQIDPKTRADIWYSPIESGMLNLKAAVKLVGSEAMESQGQLSPDGKWLAYSSNETGTEQVYIRPFPTGAIAWKVSIERGYEPQWRSNGRELFFTVGRQSDVVTLMAATVETDGRGGLRTGVPQKLFDAYARVFVIQQNMFSYSPHPDGQRFLVNTIVDMGQPTVNVITHWQKTLAEDARPR